MTHPGAVSLRLPHGLLAGDARHGDAVVRPLTGREEELLADGAGTSLAAQVTALLGACVERIGPAPPGPDGIRALCVGDREALLLHLRRATIGDAIDCVLSCPAPSCGERLDVRLSTADLLLPPYPDPQEWSEESFGEGARRAMVRFRLPTGADQEAVADLAVTAPAAAAHRVLERCVDRVTGPAGADASLDPSLADALAQRMSELDPQAELRLDVGCPSCGGRIDTLLDIGTFFLAELARSRTSLYQEIHTLACWYHWAESEILSLTAPRRRRYLELIAARSPALTPAGVG
jgi:hypothetical protein